MNHEAEAKENFHRNRDAIKAHNAKAEKGEVSYTMGEPINYIPHLFTGNTTCN